MRCAIVACVVVVSWCSTGLAQKTLEAKNGMVVCVSPLAAEVGVAILKQGGNAVDASVAVAFAEAVTWPEAGNIGGGGFMLVWPGAGREPTLIDYREKAPLSATADMFAKKINYTGHYVVGVPGAVRGLEMAHKKFGKLPWKTVVMPAVQLAEAGFEMNAVLANGLNKILASPQTTNAEFRRVYGKDFGKQPWKAGDKLTLTDLGKTLRAVAERGADAFYTGELADIFDNEMTLGGGLITKQDMAAYQAVERKPLRTTYRGHDVYVAPPPSSGGTTLIEMLNMLETFDVAKNPRYSAETVHLMSEAMRRAYRDRAAYLGDPAFTKIPDYLVTKEHAKKLASTIDLTKATRSETLAGDIPLSAESDQTTHFSVMDGQGMAVSNTYTLENSYGSRIVVRGAGFILNNEMTDFNHRPGITDRKGDIGTKPNQVAGGKRMLSSMCPTIVVKDGKPVIVTGSPGGRTIINTVLCVLVNVIDYKMDGRAAVDAPRLHHQWFPDRISMEQSADYDQALSKLKAMGHTVTRSRQGDAHTILVDPKTGNILGFADKRLDGRAAGY